MLKNTVTSETLGLRVFFFFFLIKKIRNQMIFVGRRGRKFGQQFVQHLSKLCVVIYELQTVI